MRYSTPCSIRGSAWRVNSDLTLVPCKISGSLVDSSQRRNLAPEGPAEIVRFEGPCQAQFSVRETATPAPRTTAVPSQTYITRFILLSGPKNALAERWSL